MEVTVSVDVAKRCTLASRVLGALEAEFCLVVAVAHWVEVGDGCLPADDFAHGAQCCGGGLGALVIAKHGYAPGVLVESADVCALWAAVHAACAAFVDVAVLIHERVVANVTPAQVAGVVGPDAADDARCLGLGVVVRACGVVHGRCGGWFGVVRGLAGACTPLCAGDHLGHAPGVGVRDRVDAALGLAFAAVEEDSVEVLGGGGCAGVGAAAVEKINAAGGDLDALGFAHEDRFGAELVAALRRVDRVHFEPFGPGAVGLLGADECGNVAVAGPGQADERELAVVGELLDHAAYFAFFAALGADGGVVDSDVRAGREGLGRGVHLGCAGAEGLDVEDAVAAEHLRSDESHHEENGHHGRQDYGPAWLDRTALKTTALLHGKTPDTSCENSGNCDWNAV